MDYDIVIAGGGIAGLTAAAAFGGAGFRTLIVDPTPPVTDREAQGADLRSTAFLQPSQAFMARVGLWERLAAHAMPLETMRIMDAGEGENGQAPKPKIAKDFDSADISDLPFGWNLPNWLLRREIAAHVESLETVTFKPGLRATGLFTRTNSARVKLSDGTSASCRLAIACDGRTSTLRQEAKIDVSTTRFGQKALAFAVTHPIPHGNVSTEIHRTGGPFTLVPLPDLDGRPSSAIVWMEDGPKAKALFELPKSEFEAAMTERSTGLLGPLTLASQRTIWPIIAQHAHALKAERTALVAEAAHVVPPIGAQGLNMSLKDVETLLDLAAANPEHLGNAQMLEAYERARLPDIKLRVTGITLLNRTSQNANPLIRDARALGINALHSIKPIRTTLMRMGLGAK